MFDISATKSDNVCRICREFVFRIFMLYYGVSKSLKIARIEISERSLLGVSGPLERARLANQIQGFRIVDRLEAGEKHNR